MRLKYNDPHCPHYDSEEGCVDCSDQFECATLGNPYNCEFVGKDGRCYMGCPCHLEKYTYCTRYGVYAL